MLLRLLIVLFLALAVAGVFRVLRRRHMRRVGQQLTAVVNQPTLLYFFSESCAGCPTQWRHLEQVVEKWNGRLAIQKIDADQEPERMAQHAIFTLPTTILIDQTGVVRQINYGITPSHKLAQQLGQLG